MKKPKEPLRTPFGIYELHESLGEGGSGIVYRATDGLGVAHAIKILNPSRASSEKLARFQNEIIFGLRTIHANVVRVEDYGLASDAPFYVMPLFSRTLRGAMRDGLPPDDSIRLFNQILSGLEAAHLSGVTHRDLKPENCLLSGDGKQLVIADWGIAHFEEDELYVAVETKNADRLANFAYAAPEQRTRGGRVGAAADIFSAGLIINEMFTHEVVQGAGAQRIAQVSPDYAFLDDLVAEMIQQNPAARPASIDAVKLKLAGHRVLFESRQKLDALNRAEVVPLGTSDDPLVRVPMKIISQDYEAHQGVLILKLNHDVPRAWADVFYAIMGVSLRPAAGLVPDAVQFPGGQTATLGVDANSVGDAYRMLQEWLTRANSDYAERDKRLRAERERAELAELERLKRLEETRQRVLSQLPRP